VKFAALLCLLVSFSPALAGEKSFKLPPARVRKVLRALEERQRCLGRALENVRCLGQVEIEIAGQKITEKARVTLKMPDKLRVEIVESNIPLFQGWVIVRNGDRAFTYDPLGERMAEVDLRSVTQKDPARLDTVFTIWAVFFQQNLHDISYVGSFRRAGRLIHRIDLVLPRPVLFKLWFLKRSELLLEDSTGRPLQEEVYDVEGRKVLELNFSDPSEVKRGLFLARRIEGRDGTGTRFQVLLSWIQKKALVPVRIEFQNPEIGFKGHIRYSDFILNRSIPESDFAPAG
jgi:outer membrane lipoprotein-sorting protein